MPIGLIRTMKALAAGIAAAAVLFNRQPANGIELAAARFARRETMKPLRQFSTAVLCLLLGGVVPSNAGPRSTVGTTSSNTGIGRGIVGGGAGDGGFGGGSIGDHNHGINNNGGDDIGFGIGGHLGVNAKQATRKRPHPRTKYGH